MPVQHPILSHVADFIDKNQLFTGRGGSLAVAISGGADSVALLSILLGLEYECVALHCNFHLRGEESDADQSYVEQLCKQLGVKLYVKHFDVGAYRASHRSSVEMACRELRYEWFESMREELGAQAIVVAHNQNDNVETFMLNALRGTSIAGLTGMRPFDVRTHVARPLLSTRREEIEQYLSDIGLRYVTDSTNAQNVFRRNSIRNVVIPAIEQYFPDVVGRIASTINLLSVNESFYADSIHKAFGTALSDDGSVNLKLLLDCYSNHASLILYEVYKRAGMSMTQANDIVRCAELSGRQFRTGGGIFLVDHGQLRHIKTTNVLPKLRIDVVDVADVDFSRCPDVAYFSTSLLESQAEIELRSWKKGDRIKPWGMKGSKKLSDIFTDAKLGVDQKDNVAVVVCRGEIIWVVGLRNSRLYPLTSDCCQAVCLSIDYNVVDK